jgi:hypothetical protein
LLLNDKVETFKMAAPKGHPAYPGGGRPKGSTTRVPYFSVAKRLEERGIDLVQRIMDELAKMDDPEARANVYLKLLEYCDAKRKAVEVSATVDQTTRTDAIPTEALLKYVSTKDEDKTIAN